MSRGQSSGCCHQLRLFGEAGTSAAEGKVTATDQEITASDAASSSDSEKLTGLIETNADIQSGDSGPLYDSDGKVIGIDTAAQNDQAGIFTSTQISAAIQKYSPDDSVRITWTDAGGTSHSQTVTLEARARPTDLRDTRRVPLRDTRRVPLRDTCRRRPAAPPPASFLGRPRKTEPHPTSLFG